MFWGIPAHFDVRRTSTLENPPALLEGIRAFVLGNCDDVSVSIKPPKERKCKPDTFHIFMSI